MGVRDTTRCRRENPAQVLTQCGDLRLARAFLIDAVGLHVPTRKRKGLLIGARTVHHLIAASVFLLAFPFLSIAQEIDRGTAPVVILDLPEAPQPQGASESALPQAAPSQNPQPQTSSTGSSTSQGQDGQLSEDERRQKAEQQIKQQESQRVLGILPMFNTSYVNDAVSLTAKQKMKLAFRTAIDPVTFAVTGIVAGFGELSGGDDNNNGFGWGPAGYGKRWGAAYLDSFNGTMIGNGILPSILHQDPRYFRLGHGSTMHRFLYAAATTVICKHDNTRRWEPNYSNVGGNLIAGYISNFYYPSSDRNGWEQTISSGMIVTAEGAIGGVFQEFWPDISRKLFHKDPTHGLDAQMRAQEAAAKQDEDKKQSLPPAPK